MKSHLNIRYTFYWLLYAAAAALVAGGVAYWQLEELSARTIRQALDNAHASQQFMLDQRRRNLEQLSKGVSSNASFVAYIARALEGSEAGTAIDTGSIRDLLEERRGDLAVDVIAVLDASGRVIAATGSGVPMSSDIAKSALVRSAVRDGATVAGTLMDQQTLLQTTLAPLMRGTDVGAFLLTGYKIDARFAREIRAATGSDLAVMTSTATTASLVTSSLADHPGDQLRGDMGALHDSMQADSASVSAMSDYPIKLDNGRWYVRAGRLDRGDDSLQLLTLLPPAALETTERSIIVPIAAAVLLIWLFAFVVAVVLWRRHFKPLLVISQLSDRIVQGDYALAYQGRGRGLVQDIGSALNHVLTALGRYRTVPGTPRRRASDVA